MAGDFLLIDLIVGILWLSAFLEAAGLDHFALLILHTSQNAEASPCCCT